ncbi:hypothetical protein ACFPPD_12300 [Cohnella suwonensis]|uniref:Uncharacterized protein n=1 Tax=Cohnella suwonensis TaxID=696072 RepID=A0ABW0LUE8_9BACL
MTREKGLAAFARIGTVGAILFTTVPIMYGIMGETTIQTIVDSIAQTLIMLGLVGVFMGYADKMGRFGLVATMLMMVGFVFQVFMKMCMGLVKPVLMEYAPQTVANGMPPSPLGEAISISMMFFPLTAILFGISIFVSKIPRAKLLGALLTAGPFGFVLPFGIFITPFLFAFAYSFLTYTISSGRLDLSFNSNTISTQN